MLAILHAVQKVGQTFLSVSFRLPTEQKGKLAMSLPSCGFGSAFLLRS